jgi:hypothetical protein
VLGTPGPFPPGSLRRWSQQHRWRRRAAAWDAEQFRLEDAARLQALHEMDDTHQGVARALIAAGIRALAADPQLTPHQAARYLDLGTRLQRATLLGERLAPPGVAPPAAEDDNLSPLERIARELAGTA